MPWTHLIDFISNHQDKIPFILATGAENRISFQRVVEAIIIALATAAITASVVQYATVKVIDEKLNLLQYQITMNKEVVESKVSDLSIRVDKLDIKLEQQKDKQNDFMNGYGIKRK